MHLSNSGCKPKENKTMQEQTDRKPEPKERPTIRGIASQHRTLGEIQREYEESKKKSK